MLKKFTKFLLIILMLFVVSSSSIVCLADETHEHTDDETNLAQTTTEIHNGDLYLFDNDVVMDKVVYGNVFIFGNNVTITGDVHGNVFVFANNVTFEESFIRYSIFVCANSVYYNGYCGSEIDYGNLYVAARNFESTYSSFITGDIKAVCSNISLKSGIYRDAHIVSNNINLGEGKDIPVIYGSLNYTSNKQINIPDGVMETDGPVNYINSFDIFNIVLNFGTCIVTTLALFIIFNKLKPCFIQKVYDIEFSILKLVKTFGIGLASIFIVLLFILLLIGTGVGILLAILLGLIFAIIYIVSMPILTINITNNLKPALKLEKANMFYLVLSLITIILYGITLIPYVGIFFNIIMKITAIGLIIDIFIPHKDLTDEEKEILEEKKRLDKENKAKKRQEKLEIKATKKQEKLEAKKLNKEDK